ncbi:hypothetical protein ACFSVK_14195 [Azorhizophilus paspali]|uniref:Uncharacterized protein n=1 Tax=Azorhizophilus paspali TaxID=69963 RepID=A0ABV6SNV9_AZOPA
MHSRVYARKYLAWWTIDYTETAFDPLSQLDRQSAWLHPGIHGRHVAW